MRVYSITLLALFMLFSIANAQDSLVQVLKPGDVEHFIETYPKLEADLESFGVEVDSRNGEMTMPEAIEAQNDFLGILQKHGWDETFFQKAGVILLGYSMIVYDEEIVKADSSFDASLKEIESNPNLSDEMKEQLKEQLKTAQGVLSEQQSAFRQNIHPADIELVRPHVEELKETLENEE
ncbi:hypothetical protein JXI42_10530 [bacterium]|nr:hypothetical protein [bacterium]